MHFYDHNQYLFAGGFVLLVKGKIIQSLPYLSKCRIDSPFGISRDCSVQWSAKSTRLRGPRMLKRAPKRRCFSIIYWSFIASFTKFNDLSVSRSTCDEKDVPVSIHYRKPRPDVLTLSKTFYDISVLRNLFSKAPAGINAYQRVVNRRVKGIEGWSVTFIVTADFITFLSTN